MNYQVVPVGSYLVMQEGADTPVVALAVSVTDYGNELWAMSTRGETYLVASDADAYKLVLGGVED